MVTFGSRARCQLGRFEDEEAKTFRMEYLLHNVMTKSANGDTVEMRPILKAIAEPIMKLTNKYYLD